jgi:hypothetical protein
VRTPANSPSKRVKGDTDPTGAARKRKIVPKKQKEEVVACSSQLGDVANGNQRWAEERAEKTQRKGKRSKGPCHSSMAAIRPGCRFIPSIASVLEDMEWLAT